MNNNGPFMQIVWMLLILPFMVSVTSCDKSRTITTRSPDNNLTIKINISKGRMEYSVSADNNELISASSMGLDFGQAGIIPSAGWEVSNVVSSSVDTTWKPVWGKSSLVPDRYNETTIELQGPGIPFNKLYVKIRAYNDGVAFRYEVPDDARGEDVICKKELTAFNFAGDDTAWFYNGESANLGPVRLTKVNGNRKPVMTVKVNDHAFMAILEADLITGSPVTLNSKEGKTAFSIVSSPGIIKPGYRSSWRVILYGETPGALVDSHVVQLLNPPPAAGSDFSWVKPGIAMWDWRIRGAGVDGFKYGGDYSSWVRLVNFASKNGIPYVLLDGGWYGPEKNKASDPFNNSNTEKVKKLIAYAGAKHVRIWLYLDDIALKAYPMERVLKTFGEWGVAGVKVGFMQGTMAAKNTRTRRITKLCARDHLMCDFHDGPVIPYGQLRTWPNAVTREYCHAQLDGHKFVYPKTFVTAVFVNMLAGPLDMDNGIFDLIRMRSDHVFKSTVPSTITSEAARTLIVFSGLIVIPDIPEDYEKFPALLSFITSEQMPWKQSKSLMGKIGKYIVMARQASDGTWLVGAVTNESARELDIPLSFLGKGRYEATVIQDGDDADYLTNRLAHKISESIVDSSDNIHVRLASGGGACLIIKKK